MIFSFTWFHGRHELRKLRAYEMGSIIKDNELFQDLAWTSLKAKIPDEGSPKNAQYLSRYSAAISSFHAKSESFKSSNTLPPFNGQSPSLLFSFSHSLVQHLASRLKIKCIVLHNKIWVLITGTRCYREIFSFFTMKEKFV